ncbi:permease [Ferdinandcohnia sp. Marseille-Q9671]
MDTSRISFFVLGILFTIMGGFMIFAGLMADAAPPSIAYMQLGMAVMSFCLSYLYPQFKQKDERMRLIRQKGMFASFVTVMLYLIVFNLALQFDLFVLTAIELLHILTTLIISTVFIAFVVYSKIY